MKRQSNKHTGYAVYSEYRDEFISPVYGTLEELDDDLKNNKLEITDEDYMNNLIIYTMTPVTSVEICQAYSLIKT
jgi:hypothetical protein